MTAAGLLLPLTVLARWPDFLPCPPLLFCFELPLLLAFLTRYFLRSLISFGSTGHAAATGFIWDDMSDTLGHPRSVSDSHVIDRP